MDFASVEAPLQVLSDVSGGAFLPLPSGPAEVAGWWRGQDPLATSALLCLAAIAYCLAASWVTGNYSQVDKLWSVTPFLYVWNYFLHGVASRGVDLRLLAMAALSTLWGLRLTYNFARKGGYSGEEDYRWPALRRIIGSAVLFEVFNLTFIASYQNVLLLLQVLPVDVAYRAAAAGTSPFGAADGAVALAFLALLAGETVADQQQWTFQNAKAAARRGGAGAPALSGDYKRGFLTRGLFRFSRHPNFFCEQAMWCVFYLFSITASGGAWLNWSLTGPALLVLLFQGSTRFTEWLTVQKYPEYRRYQRITSMLLPLPPAGSMEDGRAKEA